MSHPIASKRYCGLVQFERGAGLTRIAQSAPRLVDLFDRWSKGEKEMLCRSNDGQLFGFFFQSTKPPAMMRSKFEASGATVNADSLVLFEVGEEFSGTTGVFVRAWTWLQHH